MGKRILLIDDEPALLFAVTACLRAENYEVATARGAKEALVQLSTALPDLVISDIRMPGMDGYELVRSLRASNRTELIPVIFLTAKDGLRDRIDGFRVGIDAYLIKPFQPTELLAVIENILSRVERTHSAIANLVGAEVPVTSHAIDEELTPSELRVAREVAKGLTNKEIANVLNLSVRTVENHVSRILDKKNFANRVELTRHMLSIGENKREK